MTFLFKEVQYLNSKYSPTLTNQTQKVVHSKLVNKEILHLPMHIAMIRIVLISASNTYQSERCAAFQSHRDKVVKELHVLGFLDKTC